jgi:SAM-dependent methyltransferase
MMSNHPPTPSGTTNGDDGESGSRVDAATPETGRGAVVATPGAHPIDVFVLVFTSGVSLQEWQHSGLLTREWALYQRLSGLFRRIILVTYGDVSDLELSAAMTLPSNDPGDSQVTVEILCNDRSLDPLVYAGSIPARVAGMVRGAKSAVVKTNQMQGGEVAVRVASAMREAGVRTGLVARGGYLWSRFIAGESGAESARAAEAAAEESLLCRAADVVVGSTQRMLEDLSWRYAIESSRLIHIPNYILADHDPAGPSQRDAGEVLYAGQLVNRKRVDLLIEAVAKIKRTGGPMVTLSIIGQGPEEGALKALARELDAPVTFEPRLSHDALVLRMSRCAIYAQASELEGHPKTVLEAMATGAAVIVSDSPGLSEVVQTGVTGLRVGCDADSFAHAISQLIADEDWREMLGLAASQSARRAYSLEQIGALERDAHLRALALAGSDRSVPPAPVRFDPALLDSSPVDAAKAFARAVGGFSRRLNARDKAAFLLALDAPIYNMQGAAAIEADGGLHPKHRLMRYHDFFVDRVKPGERVLDLGCGVGAVAQSMVRRSGAFVTGVEIVQKNLDDARARNAEEVEQGTLRLVLGDITRDRAPGEYDAVVLSNVLEHLRDRAALLKTWNQWYRPKRFLIRVPAFDREWRVPFKKELGIEWRLDDTHETEYTFDQLKSELDDAGLTMDESVIRWGEYWVDARPRDAAGTSDRSVAARNGTAMSAGSLNVSGSRTRDGLRAGDAPIAPCASDRAP